MYSSLITIMADQVLTYNDISYTLHRYVASYIAVTCIGYAVLVAIYVAQK